MRKDLYRVGVFILVLWLAYVVDAIIPYAINEWGVVPRTMRGLVGIPMMPFLHGGFFHILSNTVSLVILMLLLVGSRKRDHWPIIAAIVVGNGVLVWLLGRPGNHIGASGLVFGLIGFLIFSGLREKRPVSIGVALLVGFLFGGTLIIGVMPRISSEVSWEGHLLGAIAGAGVAYLMSANRRLMSWRRRA